ncbi:MAG: hypothetical protein AAFY91_07875 [Bacteroidota bacterium]
MNISAEIRQWIDSEGSYLAGVDLLRRSLGKLPPQVAEYAKRPMITGDIYDDLVNHLRSQLPDGYEQPRRTRSADSNEPDVVKALHERGRILKKREAAVHGKMKALGLRPDAHLYTSELHTLSKEMMDDIQPKLDEIYDQIRKWENQGILPVPGEARIVQETVDKFRRRESLKQGRSHLKRRLKNQSLTDAERKAIKLDMNQKLEEQQQLEKELGL